MKVAVEAILVAARVLRRQEFGRCGGITGGLEGGIMDS